MDPMTIYLSWNVGSKNFIALSVYEFNKILCLYYDISEKKTTWNTAQRFVIASLRNASVKFFFLPVNRRDVILVPDDENGGVVVTMWRMYVTG